MADIEHHKYDVVVIGAGGAGLKSARAGASSSAHGVQDARNVLAVDGRLVARKPREH